MRMPDFSNPEVWMDNIQAMRSVNLLSPVGRDDGQPNPSDTLIANFIRELDTETNFEVMQRLIKGGRVAPRFRLKTLTAMFHAINMVVGHAPYGDRVSTHQKDVWSDKRPLTKETMTSYMFILSTLKPFDTILFTKKWDVPL